MRQSSGRNLKPATFSKKKLVLPFPFPKLDRMKFASNKRFFTLLASLVLSARVFAADFFIHDGDRVVFLGDSITEQRLYTTYIEAYALTRHPTTRPSRQATSPKEDRL